MYSRLPHHICSLGRFLAVFALLVLAVVADGYGQDQVRKYANREEFHGQALLGILLPGRIENSGNAVDGNIQNHSTLSVDVGALNGILATQFLDFGKRFNSGTPVTVKLTLPVSTLGLVDNFRIQPYTNLNFGGGVFGIGDKWRATPAGAEFQGSNLLNLLSGKGTLEFQIVPTAAFDGIWVELGSVLGLGVSIDVYHAYIHENIPTLDCGDRNKAIDVLAGVRASAADLLGALGSVEYPYNAINDTLTDYATMNVVVGALNTVYLNTIFQTPSQSGQKLRIILERPGNILDLGLLSQFSIQPYLRNQPAGPPLAASSPLLNLRLLPGTNKYELTYNIDEVFDRVELRFDNTVTALTSLRVYEVSRLPRIMLIEDPSMLNESLTNCGQVDLSAAIANYQPDHYNYRYYTEENGGTALETSIVTASGDYYIEAIDPVTGCASERVPVTATVIALPEITLSAVPAICEGEITAVITYSNLQNGANEYRIAWDNNAVGFTDVSYTDLSGSPIVISVPASAAIGEYTATLTVKNTETGCESIGYPFTVTVLPQPGRPHLTITDVQN